MALIGERVVIREERVEDMPLLTALRNDLETQAWSKTLPPDYTLEMYLKRFQEREFSFEREDGRLFDNLMMDLLREEYFARHPELEDHLPGLDTSDRV